MNNKSWVYVTSAWGQIETKPKDLQRDIAIVNRFHIVSSTMRGILSADKSKYIE